MSFAGGIRGPEDTGYVPSLVRKMLAAPRQATSALPARYCAVESVRYATAKASGSGIR
jgi:hypothetical protein